MLYATRWEFTRLQLYCPHSDQPPQKSKQSPHPAPNRPVPAQLKHSVIWCGASQKSTKCAGAKGQKPEILKNSYPCPNKHLRFSKTRKYQNFRHKRAGRPKYEGYIGTPARLLFRCNYAYQKNRDATPTHLAAQIHQKRTRAHKTTPFMQNKANFRSPANDRNLISNKHLRK